MGADIGRCSRVQRVKPRRVILVERLDEGGSSLMHELKELATAAGYEVAGVLTQVRRPDSNYQVGEGKVEELRELVKKTGACKVIFFNDLKPRQAYNLTKRLGVEVIDRFQLILEIFASRAGSKEAKLQIELAKLKRELSFAREWLRLAKLGELHGFLGGGEYAIDAYYKHVRRRIAKIEEELSKLRFFKESRWMKRSWEGGLYYVALTGYTGAGKTTLFRALTGYQGYVDGRPFATLNTKMSRTSIEGRPVVISDTVGFIDSLPPQLLDAFYTTLGEVALADIVVMVFDVSEDLKEIKRKFSAAYATLRALGVSPSKIIAVANKVDLLNGENLEAKLSPARSLGFEPIPVSALKGEGIEQLKKAILERLPGYAVVKVEIDGINKIGVLQKLRRGAFVKEVNIENGRLDAVVEGRKEWIESILRKEFSESDQ